MDTYGIGIAGAILAVVVVPLLKWLMTELTNARESFQTFITVHSENEIKVLTKIETTLDRLVERVERSGHEHNPD